MNMIVCGGRDFDNYALLKKTLDRLTSKLKKVVVISGHAQGADLLGERWAYERMYPYEVYRPDYDRHGKVAPLVRNTEMVERGDCLVAFHNGTSAGTADIIVKARKSGLEVRVIEYERNGHGRQRQRSGRVVSQVPAYPL